jgi:hypothetical protein
MIPQDHTMRTYKPITGPALTKLHARRSQRTGCPGISYVEIRSRGHRFFSVCLGQGKHRRFRIHAVPSGKDEAWRRALRCRAEHERTVQANNAAILTARSVRSDRSVTSA